jgi:hypothetical protein
MSEFIYVMQSGDGYCKIGRSSNLEARRAAIQNGNPHKVTILDYIETNAPSHDEGFLLKKFKKYRMQGEWFDLPQEYQKDTSWLHNIPKSPNEPEKSRRSYTTLELSKEQIEHVAVEICERGEKLTQKALALSLGCSSLKIFKFFQNSSSSWSTFKENYQPQENQNEASKLNLKLSKEQIEHVAVEICERGEELTQKALALSLGCPNSKISQFFQNPNSSWSTFKTFYQPPGTYCKTPSASSRTPSVTFSDIELASQKIIDNGENLTKGALAKECNVSEGTIRSFFENPNRDWRKHKRQFMPRDYVSEERIWYGIKVVLESGELLTYKAISNVIDAKPTAVREYLVQNGINWKHFRLEVQPDWFIRRGG